MTKKNIILWPFLFLMSSYAFVSCTGATFELSKRHQEFAPPTIPENSFFKYSDLSSPIVIKSSPDEYATINSEFNLSSGESYSFSKRTKDIKNFCGYYITFEYSTDKNVIIAGTTPLETKYYTPEKLANCFNHVVMEISKEYQEKSTFVAFVNNSPWEKSAFEKFFNL